MKPDKKKRKELVAALSAQITALLMLTDSKSAQKVTKATQTAAEKIVAKFAKAADKLSKKETQKIKQQKAGKLSKKESKKLAESKLKLHEQQYTKS